MREFLLAALCAVCSACIGHEVQPTRVPVASAAVPAMATASVPGASRLELRIHQATGASREQVAAILTRARQPLLHCSSAGAATVQVRLTSRDGALAFSLEPATLLDPTLRECILAALSNIELEESGSNAVGPRPSTFTSLLTISF